MQALRQPVQAWMLLVYWLQGKALHIRQEKERCESMISPNRMSLLQEWVNDIFQGLGLVFLVAVASAVLWMLSENRLGFLRSIQWPFK